MSIAAETLRPLAQGTLCSWNAGFHPGTFLLSNMRFMSDMIARFTSRVSAWLAASAAAYLGACTLHSQSVLFGLTALQVPVTLGERLSMTFGDLLGLRAYAVVIAAGLAIALPVLNLPPLRRWMPSPALRGAIAGAVAMAVILITMRQVFGFTPIAGARGGTGLLLQCAAGAAGGAVYALVRRRRQR